MFWKAQGASGISASSLVVYAGRGIQCTVGTHPHDGATAEQRSKAPDLSLGLCPAEIIDGGSGLFRGAELLAALTLDLGQTDDGFPGDVALVRQDRRDYIDGTGASLQGVPRLAVRLHAGEHIVYSGGGGIVVGLLSGQRRGG